MRVETLFALAREELAQSEQEGRETDGLRALLEEAQNRPYWQQRQALERFFAAARAAGTRSDWPYHEPSDLEAIRAARPDGPRRLVDKLPDDIADRIYGAWLGRCAGCMLGKPVEGRTRSQIEAILRAIGEVELSDYFAPVPPGAGAEEIGGWSPDPRLLRGRITAAERDDDTDYTVLGLHILQEMGPHFLPCDVAQQWLDHLPYARVYTAERVAYRNFVAEIWPPESARHLNPFREWIGAQIRADAWGYVAAGWPERAAELAWRDACISHTKNGIYGEMFFAALIAAALVVDDLRAAVEAAAAEIPARCRFREVVDDCVAWCERDSDWRETWERIKDKYGHYHPVHTLNNAAVVLMALLHSDGDFSKAICVAVMAGWDTDCNGATAGSVAGALVGASAIPQRWTEPLNDTLYTSLEGMNVVKISKLAEQAVGLARQVHDA